MKRPFGVWIIGLIGIVSAVLRILAGVAFLGLGGLSVAGKLDAASGTVTGTAFGFGVVMLVVGVLYLIFSLAFFGLRHWSWVTMMVIQWISIIAVVVQLVLNGWDAALIASIVLPLIIVLYLSTSKVRRAFAG